MTTNNKTDEQELKQEPKATLAKDDEQRQKVFQISANRGRARHKMRYVERSLDDTGDCRLCVGAISPEDDDSEQS